MKCHTQITQEKCYYLTSFVLLSEHVLFDGSTERTVMWSTNICIWEYEWVQQKRQLRCLSILRNKANSAIRFQSDNQVPGPRIRSLRGFEHGIGPAKSEYWTTLDDPKCLLGPQPARLCRRSWIYANLDSGGVPCSDICRPRYRLQAEFRADSLALWPHREHRRSLSVSRSMHSWKHYTTALGVAGSGCRITCLSCYYSWLWFGPLREATWLVELTATAAFQPLSERCWRELLLCRTNKQTKSEVPGWPQISSIFRICSQNCVGYPQSWVTNPDGFGSANPGRYCEHPESSQYSNSVKF